MKESEDVPLHERVAAAEVRIQALEKARISRESRDRWILTTVIGLVVGVVSLILQVILH